jgi:uncharacterized protein YbcI
VATGEQLLQIANRISALNHECFGKGPARARAYREEDFLFVVLEGGFIDAEETLVRHERHANVRAFREAFQNVMEAQTTGIVEDVLGVGVLDYVSQVLTQTNVVVEIFQLAPSSTS